jgi:hypothetical protein
MDLAAELTLQIAAFLQTDPDAPRSAARWAFVPGPGRGADTFAEAAARLAALDKPVVVGALDQPGYLALWAPAALAAAERQHVEHTVRNQQAFLAAKLAHLNVGEDDRVVFEGWGSRVEAPAREVRRWLGEYALTWGWTLDPPTDGTHRARLLVLRGGRHWSPGATCARPGSAA